MKTLLLLLATAASITAHASASKTSEIFKDVTFTQPKCFGHVYSKANLAAKPKQTVTAIKASLIKYSADTSMESSGLKLELKLAGEPRATYKAEFSCFENEGQTLCAIECDGGSVTVQARDSKSLTLKSNGFTIHGGCDDQTEEAVKFLKATAGGDDLFKLEAKACPAK